MKIATIIQARMNSARFPNKVLIKIKEKPLLEYLIDQVSHKNTDMPIIIATSNKKSDQIIVDYCQRNNLKFYTGSLSNVASRFYEIIKIYNLNFFVRVCADSPLLDGNLIKKSIAYLDKNIDIITNVMPRTFPKGQSVEVVNCKTFLTIYDKLSSEEDFEHVTRYFYNNSKSFNILNLKNYEDLSSLNLSVDTEEDYQKVSKIISKMKKKHFEYSYKDVISKYN
tara:strand:- start:561 stop:1232 length:672 start_codon:yes stop_codon:yes gene_type:complete